MPHTWNMSIPQDIDNPTYAWKNPESGLIEIIDCRTGAVRAVQRDASLKPQDMLIEHTLPDGSKLLMQKGIDPALVLPVGAGFNSVLADFICQRVASGESLTKICKEPGFPDYTTICRWKREEPSFAKNLEDARKDRAESFRDKAVEEASIAHSTKDPITASTLRVETYKWAAGIDDSKFSQRQQKDATGPTQVQIVISTGIDREERIVQQYTKEVQSVTTNSPTIETTTALDSSGSAARGPSTTAEAAKKTS